MIFFPVDVAIALTGVVHFFNNIFKLILVGKKADKQVVLRFGIPAVIAAFIGAWLLLQIADLKPGK
jgi:Sulfite exporter TauE/SafE.